MRRISLSDTEWSILLATLAAGFISLLLLAQDGSVAGMKLPWGGTAETLTVLEEVTPDEAARAEGVLRAERVIDNINGGQPWAVDLATTSREGLKKVGVLLNISWELPVSSNGPWVVLMCEGTISVEQRALWHNVKSVTAVVALNDGRILALLPRHSGPEGRTESDQTYREPNQEVEPLPMCPPGRADEEQ